MFLQSNLVGDMAILKFFLGMKCDGLLDFGGESARKVKNNNSAVGLLEKTSVSTLFDKYE